MSPEFLYIVNILDKVLISDNIEVLIFLDKSPWTIIVNLFPWSPTSHNVKNINKHAVLDLIRFTPGGISRAELAQRMMLSRAAVSVIINDLLAANLIQESESRNGGNGTSGRPPIILEVNSKYGHVVGIDMGATHLSIILANFTAQVIDEIEVPFFVNRGPDICIAEVDKTFQNLLQKNNKVISDISAIGIDVPGPIVAEAGIVLAPPIMPGWDRYPIRETLEKLWKCPVALSNDAESGALGEWAFGAGRGERDLAYIKVGTGIGAGLLLDGRIYRGATGSAGEIGHLTMVENGPLCNCGNTGCLEALAGGQAIARQAQEVVHKGERTILSSMGPVEKLTALEVAAAARRGDLVAQQIVTQAGSQLGIALAGLVNLFNPGMVVVGGGVAQIGDLFLQPIRSAVSRRSLPAAARTVKITTATLGRRSSSIGAAVEALSLAIHQNADRKEVSLNPAA
jgi:glucokinase-like ROK family protein